MMRMRRDASFMHLLHNSLIPPSPAPPPPPQCGAPSRGPIAICARGRRVPSYPHGNTGPCPARHLAADLAGRREETGAALQPIASVGVTSPTAPRRRAHRTRQINDSQVIFRSTVLKKRNTNWNVLFFLSLAILGIPRFLE